MILFCSTMYSQNNIPNLPIDSITKKITYSEVIVDSLTNKQELFSRAREWFAKAYNSSTNVIQMEDKESGKIIGKALMSVNTKSLGVIFPNGNINYTISIYIKDGKYKYEITDFNHTDVIHGGGFGDCEKMINPKKGYKYIFDYFLPQLDNNIRALVIDLKSGMKTKKGIKKDEW